MIKIDGGASSGQMNSTGMGAPGEFAPKTETGVFRGEQVQVKDAASALADAAEELSLHYQDKVELKTFGDRNVEPDSSEIAFMPIERIEEYLDSARGMDDREKLQDLLKRMRSGQENPRELARQHSQEPAEQFMLMQYALVQADADANVSAQGLEDLRDAIADLEMESGPAIRAGLNTIGTAAELASTRDEIVALQSTYRDVVLGGSGLADTLKLMLNRLGGAQGESLADGIANMIKVIGADLAAARPSIDSSRLQALIQDLYQLQVASTVMEGCRELTDSLHKNHGVSRFNPSDLMNEIINITAEKWVTGARFSGLPKKFGVETVGGEIALHTGNKDLLRNMPTKIFQDAESRQAVLNAVQDALDEAIDREEE